MDILLLSYPQLCSIEQLAQRFRMLWVCRSFKLSKVLYSHPLWHTSELSPVGPSLLIPPSHSHHRSKVLQCPTRVFVNQSRHIPQFKGSNCNKTHANKDIRLNQPPFQLSSSLSRPESSEFVHFQEMKRQASQMTSAETAPQSNEERILYEHFKREIKNMKTNDNPDSETSVKTTADISLTDIPLPANTPPKSSMSAFYVQSLRGGPLTASPVRGGPLTSTQEAITAKTNLFAAPVKDDLDISIKDDLDISNPIIHDLDRLTTQLSEMRYWELNNNPPNEKNPQLSSSQSMDFTIMSYNLLAPQLLLDNNYLYGKCNDHILNWSYRSTNLLKEITKSNPDILCFQELQFNDYQAIFRPKLHSLGYKSLYKKRTGNKNDGCAIFYQTSRFQLGLWQDVEYRQSDVRMLDRDNIGLIACLHPVLAKEDLAKDQSLADMRLCIATTHLLFNPRRGDIKLAQLQIMLAELDRYAFRHLCPETGNPVYHPTILCGDMNSEPNSPLYNFITEGRLNYQGLYSGNISGQSEGCNRGRLMAPYELELTALEISDRSQYSHSPSVYSISNQFCQDTNKSGNQTKQSKIAGEIEHAFNFRSSYQHVTNNGEKYITTEHSKANCTVDYIFYSSNQPKNKADESVSGEQLKCLATYKLLTEQQVTRLGGLPNAIQSSDHTSLIAKFSLNSNEESEIKENFQKKKIMK